jgi:type VI secretion system protein ImpL
MNLKYRAKVWLVGAIALLIWLLVVWFVTSFLGLAGRENATIRTALIMLGVMAICALIFYFLKTYKDKEGAAAKQADETDIAIATARNRLAAAKLSDKTRLSQLPLILCLGPVNSAKTSILTRSGLDPDLLAGEVMRGDAIVATRSVNLWYSNKTVLLEAGGRVVADPGRFTRLVRYIQPSRTSAVFSAGRQAPRVALVCLSVEDLLRAGGGEQVTTHARELRSRLLEASKKIGIRLPVYVVFTKADKIPYFTDFVRNFSSDEAKEVLGATLPWDSGPAGTYADRTASRISAAMQRLAGSLAAHRLQFLPRETQPAVLYGAYEFAREFRKLVPLATQFLVDLCKPSQLEVSPVLRGFYFSGVRAVVVEESGPLMQQATQRQPDRGRMDATMAFDPSMYGVQQSPAAQVGMVSRKVPQWMFLGRLFKDVIFKDRVALAATAGGAKVNLLRRVLLATTAGLAIFYTLMLFISFAANRRIYHRVEAAVRNVSGAALPAGDVATSETLRQLDTLRQVTELLGTWNRKGAPIGYRWGLYSGNGLYREASRIYFARFDSLLYARTAERILENIRNFPPERADTGEYSDYTWSYGLLRTHLITTAYAEKSTADRVVPVLERAWSQGHPPLSDERVRLARAQFTFFAEELGRGRNPLPGLTDSSAVRKARAYLNQFKEGQQIYEIMQAEAARAGAKSFDFDRAYPNASTVLVAPHVVPAAFTLQGWGYMQDTAFKNNERYFQGEDWVLGGEKVSERERYAIVNKIEARYRVDYANHWRAVLAEARPIPIGSLADGARKLLVLGSNTSPIMQLINAVSLNTAVDSGMRALFVPATVVSPPDSTRLIGDNAKPYLAAVLATGTALQQIGGAPEGQREGFAQEAKNQVATARNAALTLKLDFGADPLGVGGEISRLLTDQLNRVDGMLGNVGVAAVNKSGADLCSVVNPVLRKKPFSMGGPDASTKDLDNVFQRDKGAIANQLKGPIGRYAVEQGDGYAPAPGSGIKPNPAFFTFLSRATQFTKSMYPTEGAPGPRLTVTFRPLFTDDFNQISLTVDGRTLQFTTFITGEKGIAWSLNEATEAKVVVSIRGNPQPLQRTGPWSLFELFGEARNWKPAGGNKYQAAWTFTHENRQIQVPFELNFPFGAPILNPDWLRGLSCVSTISY